MPRDTATLPRSRVQPCPECGEVVTVNGAKCLRCSSDTPADRTRGVVLAALEAHPFNPVALVTAIARGMGNTVQPVSPDMGHTADVAAQTLLLNALIPLVGSGPVAEVLASLRMILRGDDDERDAAWAWIIRQAEDAA